jgi:hypothetical protein
VCNDYISQPPDHTVQFTLSEPATVRLYPIDMLLGLIPYPAPITGAAHSWYGQLSLPAGPYSQLTDYAGDGVQAFFEEGADPMVSPYGYYAIQATDRAGNVSALKWSHLLRAGIHSPGAGAGNTC